MGDMRGSFLAHLKRAAGDTSDEPWDEDFIPYYFQRFRPDGEGVERALSPLPGGSEYVRRLLPVYRATRHPGWERDTYFVVRQPRDAEPLEVSRTGNEFVENLRILANAIGDDELSSYLASIVRVEVMPAAAGLDRRTHGHVIVNETIGDYLIRRTDHDDPVAILEEAYYSIACDYDLSRYLQWPYYRHLCEGDCFEPYFRLWQCGYSYAFGEGTLTVARRL
jgi:hypothetical protein